jgi:O-antigen/teichoic acid export membrane protein
MTSAPPGSVANTSQAQAPPATLAAKTFRAVGLYTVLAFVPTAMQFLVAPLYLTYLTRDEYGVLTLANVALSLSQLVTSLHLELAFERFYFDNKEEPDHVSRVFGTAVAGILALTAISTLLTALVGPWVYALAWPSLPFSPFAWLVPIGILGTVFQGMAFMYFRNREQPGWAVVASIGPFLVGTAGTCVGMISFPGGAEGAFGGRLIGTAIGMLPALTFLLHRHRPSFSARLLREMLGYSAPLVAYTVLNTLLLQGDRLLMERWFDLRSLGLFAVAVTIAAPMEVVSMAASQAITPVLYRRLASDELGTGQLASRYYDGLSAVLSVMVVGAIVLAGPFLAWIGRGEYIGAVRFVPVLAAATLFRLRYVCASTPLFFFKETRLLPIVTAVSIGVGLGASTLAAHFVGPLGIAIGVFAWKVSQQFWAQILVRRAKRLPFSMPRSRWLIGVVLAFVLALYVFGVDGKPLLPFWAWTAAVAIALLAVPLAYGSYRHVTASPQPTG